MNVRTLSLALLLAAFSLPALADDAPAGKKASQNPDALAIDAACTAEAQTAGCGDEKVGTGLLKCVGAYRKAHKKDFKVSDGCKAALQKARADRKEKRGAK
jgi:hypothetical protein